MSLAQWSNLFVYAAMAMYTLAFLSFAVSFAATRSVRQADADVAIAEPVLAAAPAATQAGTPIVTVAPPTAADAAALARAEARLRSAQVEAEMATEARRSRWGKGGASADVDPLPPGRRSANIAMSLTWLATGLLLAAVVTRGLWAGRAPWGNMYEYALATALAMAGVFLGISLRRDVRWLGVLVSLACLATLGAAVVWFYNDSPQLVPALNSIWLVIHVSTAIVAGGAFAVGAAATVLYLVADRAERDEAAGTALVEASGLRARMRAANSRVAAWIGARVPDSKTLDTLSYKVNAFVFPLWTFAVVAGAIWAEDAWDRYWGWDPKETWAFITWLVYAGYLHARATAGWRGRKAAVVALIGFTCFLINFIGVNLFASGLHSYSGV